MHCQTCGIPDDGSLLSCGDCDETVCTGCASMVVLRADNQHLQYVVCPECKTLGEAAARGDHYALGAVAYREWHGHD